MSARNEKRLNKILSIAWLSYISALSILSASEETHWNFETTYDELIREIGKTVPSDLPDKTFLQNSIETLKDIVSKPIKPYIKDQINAWITEIETRVGTL